MAGVRETTIKLTEMAEEGMIAWQTIAEMALWFMSEDDVADMCRANAIFDDDEGDEE